MGPYPHGYPGRWACGDAAKDAARAARVHPRHRRARWAARSFLHYSSRLGIAPSMGAGRAGSTASSGQDPLLVVSTPHDVVEVTNGPLAANAAWTYVARLVGALGPVGTQKKGAPPPGVHQTLFLTLIPIMTGGYGGSS